MSRFIIGTGRCGSTFLSSMLAQHPKVLAIDEFLYGSMFIDTLRQRDLSGEEFAKVVLCTHMSVTDVLAARRWRILENSEHNDAPSDLGLPLLPHHVISTWTDENPLEVFEEVLAYVRTLPVRPLGAHYRALFDWLARRFDKTLWIERSGNSIEAFRQIKTMFPEAKFVHIHRDGMEAALSMREHVYYKLAISWALNPPSDEELEAATLHPNPGKDDSDPIYRRYVTEKVGLRQLGQYWSEIEASGFRDFATVPPAQMLDVRFEDITNKPHETLARIASFFDLPEGGDWIERAASRIRPVPLRAPQLPPEDYKELELGCRMGQILLNRAKTPSDAVWDAAQRLVDIQTRHGQGSRYH